MPVADRVKKVRMSPISHTGRGKKTNVYFEIAWCKMTVKEYIHKTA